LAFSAILGDFGRLSAPRIDFERFHPSQVGNNFDPTDRPDAPAWQGESDFCKTGTDFGISCKTGTDSQKS
jgi:hypothetical protein